MNQVKYLPIALPLVPDITLLSIFTFLACARVLSIKSPSKPILS